MSVPLGHYHYLAQCIALSQGNNYLKKKKSTTIFRSAYVFFFNHCNDLPIISCSSQLDQIQPVHRRPSIKTLQRNDHNNNNNGNKHPTIMCSCRHQKNQQINQRRVEVPVAALRDGVTRFFK